MSEEGGSVLDASALLAYVHDEPGADAVEEALAARAWMNSVNWVEVLSKLVDESGQDVDSILNELRKRGLPGGLLTLLPLTVEDAQAMARLRPVTRAFGLSMADRACLALAIRLGLPVLTTDRVWHEISLGVAVRLIR